MLSKSPKLNALITRFGESYSSIMTRESTRLKKIKQQLVEFCHVNALIYTGVKKCNFRVSRFSVLPGNAEAQVIWGGTVKRLLIAYFIGSISAKNIKIRSRMSSYSKPKVGCFLKYGV